MSAVGKLDQPEVMINHVSGFVVPRFWSAWIACVALLATVCAGCGGADVLTSTTSKRLKCLACVYLDFVAATGRTPNSLEELQAHQERLPAFVIESMAPEDDAGFEFTSDRDGEPFVIRFGVPPTGLSQRIGMVIAYEKLGDNGRRLVANLDGSIECLDEATCRKRGVIK